MPMILIYMLLCLAVAIFGANRKFGFWGYFFASVLLSPLLGLIVVLASDRRKEWE